MVEPAQVVIALSTRRYSPLCTFASSVLFVYFCGIGFYLWTSNFACRLRNLGEEQPIFLSSMTWDIEQRGRYLAVKNYIRAALHVDKTKTMTFCAAATTTELYHVTEICSRWLGPMSVSVYAPGSDFKTALRKIFHLRLSDPCVHQNVTWHVYFDSEFSPPQKNLRSPEEEAELTKASPTYEMWPKGTFKSHGTLPFPVNVGRNIALQESRTDYVLVSDLHYYPSAQIIPRFLKLLKFQGKTGKKVYVLPVFRMLGYGKPPATKTELVEMISNSDIKLSSSTSDCSECNIFPNARKWLEVRLPEDSLSVYYVSHEKEEFKSWQPFYISQKNIPVFDEDQTKEGKYDRKLQLLELCFQHYEFHILDNAFLVQVQEEEESIKDVNGLRNFVLHNTAARKKKLEILLCRYGFDTGCSI